MDLFPSHVRVIIWYLLLLIAGVHVLFLTPYIDHTPGSAQYKW